MIVQEEVGLEKKYDFDFKMDRVSRFAQLTISIPLRWLTCLCKLLFSFNFFISLWFQFAKRMDNYGRGQLFELRATDLPGG